MFSRNLFRGINLGRVGFKGKNNFFNFAIQPIRPHSNSYSNNRNNNNNEKKNKSNYLFQGIALFGFGLLTWNFVTILADDQKEDGIRGKLISKYEARLREFSSPEKLFEYFATVQYKGEIYMTPQDFIRSLSQFEMDEDYIPTNQWGSKKSLKEAKKDLIVPEFFKNYINEKHGLITFSEYLFLITLLSIPLSDFIIAFKMFDLNGDGTVDRGEFATVINVMMGRSILGQKQRKYRNGEILTESSKITHKLFGANEKFNIDNFSTFLNELHSTVLKLEFDQIQHDGFISAFNFAKVLVGHAKLIQLKRYEKNIQQLRNSNQKLTFNDLQSVDKLLQNIEQMQIALETFRGTDAFTRTSFERAASAVANVKLSKEVLDVIFAVFDQDKDGRLEPHEFVSVVSTRKSLGLNQPRDIGFSRKFNCIKECFYS
eukprot:TRINITY_DN320_c0_g4_i1.p1 TRINITY_DN320_c0_g4~~TRINITY_DN320_c0_g4_i1.p1  ORF type:complete len:429 (+),score=172.31 TRINITY_DN320_c0_g4_i1:26-1312(+)